LGDMAKENIFFLDKMMEENIILVGET